MVDDLLLKLGAEGSDSLRGKEEREGGRVNGVDEKRRNGWRERGGGREVQTLIMYTSSIGVMTCSAVFVLKSNVFSIST